MELAIRDVKNQAKGKVSLPRIFSEPIRGDLIKRAVHALQSSRRQRYGSDQRAGKNFSAKLSRRRRKYRGGYGAGQSRVPRKVLSRAGSRLNLVGAVAPGTTKGRRAHPPKSSKIWEQSINKKENRKAIRSAVAATIDKDVVIARGHKAPTDYPFVISNDLESMDKTKTILQALNELGLTAELERAGKKNIRAGKGKMRSRKYQRAVGPLLVVGSDCKLADAAKNLPGCDVAIVHALNAEILSPGAHPGRLTIFTQNAIDRLDKEGLFQ